MKVLVEGFKFPYFISTDGIVSGGKYNRSKIKVNRRRDDMGRYRTITLSEAGELK